MRSLLLMFVMTCGGSTGLSGPTVSGRINDGSEEVSPLQSSDILARDAVTKRATVKHILIAWRELAPSYPGGIDARAKERGRAEADTLAGDLLARVRNGEAIEPLMAVFSEDSGSAASGKSYDVTVDAKLVFEFKRLSLRLNVGESGLVQTQFGWHVIKRLE